MTSLLVGLVRRQSIFSLSEFDMASRTEMALKKNSNIHMKSVDCSYLATRLFGLHNNQSCPQEIKGRIFPHKNSSLS
jgi:hypothetical protein